MLSKAAIGDGADFRGLSDRGRGTGGMRNARRQLLSAAWLGAHFSLSLANHAAACISLAIPTRNDNYPSNVLAVQNKSLLILQGVNWKPLAWKARSWLSSTIPILRRPSLSESLRVGEGRYATVKVISVPAERHRRFAHWEKRVFHQTCAVNVALQRSRGRLFVYRAADHIYSDSLIRFLSSRSLLEDRIYPCDRCDIDSADFDAVPTGGPLEDISAMCEAHVAEWHPPSPSNPAYRIPALHTNGCGDFLLMARSLWMRIAGLRQGRYPVFLDYDSLALHAAYALCGREEILPPDCRVYKLRHGLRTVDRMREVWAWRWRIAERALSLLAPGGTATNFFRAALNYPRRLDRTFEGVSLDYYERHFVLPAFLWARGFPFVRQNRGAWGLRRRIASGDHAGIRRLGQAKLAVLSLRPALAATGWPSFRRSPEKVGLDSW